MLKISAERQLKTKLNTLQYDTLCTIHYILDLPSEDFFKVIESIGLKKWFDKHEYWDLLATVISGEEPQEYNPYPDPED